MLDPLNAEIRPFWKSPLKLLHLDGSLLLPAHFGRLREELSIDGLAEQSLSHVTDMQAATSHVQSGDATEEAAMGDDDDDDNPDAQIGKYKNPIGVNRFGATPEMKSSQQWQSAPVLGRERKVERESQES
ncbi:hypothetical protein C1H46_024912 [Malus baccata]|uniref:Uncharacterized protein n=1 Tax=Malus baccata TaxID=106549 RepID=A0A540LSM2_MALBA|nr:hypothetical protein C1H46_024912 [Malus baccata]